MSKKMEKDLVDNENPWKNKKSKHMMEERVLERLREWAGDMPITKDMFVEIVD